MTNSNKGKSRDDKSNAGKRTADRRERTERTQRTEPRERNERDGARRSTADERPKKFNETNERPRFDSNDKRGFKSKTGRPAKNNFDNQDGFKKSFDHKEGKRSYVKKDSYAKDGASAKFGDRKDNRYGDNRPFRKRDDKGFKNKKEDKGERVAPTLRNRKSKVEDDLIRLNRYIANAGICSRRKADELIEAGVVSVNGKVINELGFKVDPYKDEVRYNGELLKREKKVYVLLNKPKDYITTTDDPQERKTVMHLVDKASRERIYPVGRLDRNTTGLLLMTNDGDLADRLSHPRNGITKIYQVELNRNLTQGDFNKIQFGLELEDGFIKPDNISYVAGASKNEVGIQIHSGKNRIVRRIFEHLGYEVVKLDRVVYGNLTKKDLPRGRWRYLEEHELIQIKHLIK
ncbi:pseudouridine synthase [Pedobacter nanyangensis]|uniref:pseudouridine synthase n=1 Tax=Pedobacter nanyangensis TaxID=1562389 RepID=UPI000DE42753|nr:pseudouridine synthase [Pedobacter nanyangensis]